MISIWVILIVIILAVVLWGMIEMNKIRHKVYAIFAIGLLFFLVISGSFVLNGKNINLNSVDGIFEAGKLYLSFLGVAGKNLFTLTGNAVNLDWNPNLTKQNSSSK
jgi:hypothetical protein